MIFSKFVQIPPIVIESEFLIVGQGLAGSVLSWELMKRGKSVTIIDKDAPYNSSKAAAGLYNPITGRKMVKTWLADELFENIIPYYDQLQTEFNALFHHKKSIYRPFINQEEQNDWMGRWGDDNYSKFIQNVHQSSISRPGVQDPFGGLELKNTGYVDLPAMLTAFRDYFETKGNIRLELFNHSLLTIGGGYITYQDIRARSIIFCDGVGALENPFWKHLKFHPVNGDVLDIDTVIDSNLIINRGVFIIPKNGYSTVGSSYNHQELGWTPNDKDLERILEKLKGIFKGNFRILNRRAGTRPATFDRRPFVGFHPEHPEIGIFNGLGTKGVSLAPYFAEKFVDHMLKGSNLPEQVLVTR